MRTASPIPAFLFFVLLSFLALAAASAEPVTRLGSRAGYRASITSLEALEPALQQGWEAGLSFGVESADPFSVQGAWKPVFSARIQLDAYSLGASFPQSDGNLYRAWNAIGGSLLGGIRLPAFTLPFVGTAATAWLEAGAGLRTTKYSGTGLVSANAAFLAEAGLEVQLSPRLSAGFRLPFEHARKAGATSAMFGIGTSISWRLEKKAAGAKGSGGMKR